MNKSAKAFDNSNFFLIDLIDAFKGSGHCQREWVTYQLKTKDIVEVEKELKLMKFWRS